MAALLYKHYSGYCKATEIEGDQRTCGKRSGDRNVDNRLYVQLEA